MTDDDAGWRIVITTRAPLNIAFLRWVVEMLVDALSRAPVPVTIRVERDQS